MTDSTHDFFKTLAKILLRCWIFGSGFVKRDFQVAWRFW